jgi:serine phosphatase RsbU (regulator of sigma subunit)/CheY-like chemotaxis protein
MAQEEIEKIKLLVVDDETDNLDLLYRTFRHEFDVYRADSAFGALQVLEQHGEMGIIISDQRMPRMKGTELLRRTAEHFPDTIRIVLTGYTDVEDLVDAINTGQVFKYITKPWNSTDLRRVIQQAAETYRAIKRRTGELNRALRRESVFNAMITAIRESLDYRQILETTVETLGKTFDVEACVLLPLQSQVADSVTYTLTSDQFIYRPDPALLATTTHPHQSSSEQAELEDYFRSELLLSTLKDRQPQVQVLQTSTQSYAQLIVPLIYQKEALAILSLYKLGSPDVWSSADQRLINDVVEQASLAISQAKLYQRTQNQTQKMLNELSVARQIQSNLLRQSLPEEESVRIQALCYPAREVGGDFFEVYSHPSGDIWLAVGDVSGKGVPAALFMSSTISLMRREMAQEVSPEPNHLLSNLNASLLDGLVNSNCFITLAIARYTPSTQTLTYANAGHIFPMLWSTRAPVHPSGKKLSPPQKIEPQYLDTRGVPLGIKSHWEAGAETLQLSTGDVFLLASDGLTEARISSELLNQTDGQHHHGGLHLPSMSPEQGYDSGNGLPPDYQMLRQQGLWELIKQQPLTLKLDEIVRKIQAHSLSQEDDQTILSMEIL